jgi:hypothetical protein
MTKLEKRREGEYETHTAEQRRMRFQPFNVSRPGRKVISYVCEGPRQGPNQLSVPLIQALVPQFDGSAKHALVEFFKPFALETRGQVVQCQTCHVKEMTDQERDYDKRHNPLASCEIQGRLDSCGECVILKRQ